MLKLGAGNSAAEKPVFCTNNRRPSPSGCCKLHVYGKEYLYSYFKFNLLNSWLGYGGYLAANPVYNKYNSVHQKVEGIVIIWTTVLMFLQYRMINFYSWVQYQSEKIT